MATRRKRKAPKQPAIVDQYLRPTAEREAHNDFRNVGMARQIVPPIVRLHEAGLLNDQEFAALAYYRDQASLAHRSPVKSCIDFSPKGGHGPGVAILSAQIETWKLERDMGQLAPMCRAICVDDITVEGWCLHKYGSPDAETVTPDMRHVAMTLMELKYAAGGIVI